MATKTVAVVMVGYRNASILVANRGVVDQRETSALGFIKLVEQVKSRISTMADSARLAKAIALSGWEVRTEPLTPLAVSTVAQVRQQEIIKLAEVIMAARSQYISSLTSWLRDTKSGLTIPFIERIISLDAIAFPSGEMVKKTNLQPHLTSSELKTRYLCSTDRVESRRWHLLWLVSKNWTIQQAAQAVGINYDYAKDIVKGYNQRGEDARR